MRLENQLQKISLILLTLWWGGTILIDFIIVPNVFGVIENFFNAGQLGLILFSHFNRLEIIFFIPLFILFTLKLKKGKYSSLFLMKYFALFVSGIIVFIYFFHLTPKLSELTTLWIRADQMGSVSINGILDIQQEHQFFHRLYVTMDSVKLLLLSSVLGLMFYHERIEIE